MTYRTVVWAEWGRVPLALQILHPAGRYVSKRLALGPLKCRLLSPRSRFWDLGLCHGKCSVTLGEEHTMWLHHLPKTYIALSSPTSPDAQHFCFPSLGPQIILHDLQFNITGAWKFLVCLWQWYGLKETRFKASLAPPSPPHLSQENTVAEGPFLSCFPQSPGLRTMTPDFRS